jgi:hypothetical protein
MNQDQVKDWRDLCEAAASEQDPNKLMALVAQIITAVDDRNRRVGSAAGKTKNDHESSLPRPVEHSGDSTCASVISL